MAYNPYSYHSSNTIPWVQGESGAKSYPVAPGGSVILMDSEQPIFYIKSADQSGMPSLRRFRFEEITDAPVRYVTHEEFEKRISELLKEERHESADGNDQ